MANRIEEEGTRFANPNDVQSLAAEYIKLKESITFMETRQKEIREKLFSKIETEGLEETSGSITLYLDSPVGAVLGIQKTRRAKRTLNEDLAESIIEQAGIADEIYEMKRTINEGALMSAFYEDKITEEQLDEMFPTTVQWALNMVKK